MIDYRSIQGKVTALDLESKTIQVMPTDGSMATPVRVGVRDQTAIHQGILPLTLARLKIGEDVTLRYSGAGTKWFADSISIQDPSVAVAHYRGVR